MLGCAHTAVYGVCVFHSLSNRWPLSLMQEELAAPPQMPRHYLTVGMEEYESVARAQAGTTADDEETEEGDRSGLADLAREVCQTQPSVWRSIACRMSDCRCGLHRCVCNRQLKTRMLRRLHTELNRQGERLATGEGEGRLLIMPLSLLNCARQAVGLPVWDGERGKRGPGEPHAMRTVRLSGIRTNGLCSHGRCSVYLGVGTRCGVSTVWVMQASRHRRSSAADRGWVRLGPSPRGIRRSTASGSRA